jgi:hypothetical protein
MRCEDTEEWIVEVSGDSFHERKCTTDGIRRKLLVPS